MLPQRRDQDQLEQKRALLGPIQTAMITIPPRRPNQSHGHNVVKKEQGWNLHYTIATPVMQTASNQE